MKRILALALLLTSLSAFAVPARRIKKTITLADGSIKTVVLKGDEYAHFYQSQDGQMYGGDQETGYHELMPSQVEALHAKRMQQRNERRSARLAKAKMPATRTATKGKKKGLVILVNFSDRKMSIDQKEWNNYFNLPGYNSSNMGGSVHDYFWDCSYQQFDLQFDVVGPVTVAKGVSYYGKNDSAGNDLHAAEMVGEAVRLAANLGLNFKDYDWDGDGYVDQVYVIYAGYGEASGAPASTIWPHEYDLSSAKYYGDGNGPVKVDGVTVDTYACSNELYGTSGKVIDGIGTACHEFSHCLGIPDLYDTSGNTTLNFGMSVWDLMDYGCYADDGYCPTGYTSYERWISGWLTPVELNDPCQINEMPSLASSPTAYVIYNEANKNEYYLLENRQQEGWHKYDYGHGMLILHVDYDEKSWTENTVNNVSSRQRLTIIPADNNLKDATLSQITGDPWPGTTNNTALTNTSVPAAKLYNNNSNGKKLMNKPIEHIVENNGLISFAFNGGEPEEPVEVPEGLKVYDVTSTGFTTTWDVVEGASSYILELTKEGDSEGVGNPGTGSEDSENPDIGLNYNLLLEESFLGFANGGTGDGAEDISDMLDDYTATKGWKGTKLFTTPDGGVKVGSSKAKGSITTPQIKPGTDYSSVFFYASPYGSDVAKVNVMVNNQIVETMIIEEEGMYYAMIEEKSPFTLTLQAVNNTKCRFYLQLLQVIDELSELPELPDSGSTEDMNTRQTFVVSDNVFTFDGLLPGTKYGLSVAACMPDGRKSDKSSVVWVTLPEEEQGEEPGDDLGTNPGDESNDEPVVDPDNMTQLLNVRKAKLYNMQGMEMKTSKLVKGIYFMNGKKLVISK